MKKQLMLMGILETTLTNVKNATESQCDGLMINALITYLSCTGRSLSEIVAETNPAGFKQVALMEPARS